MKKLLPVLICLLLPSVLFAQQNLVPNPSFEERDGCPQGYPDLDGVVKEWSSFRITPDYFNSCSSVCGFDNQWGYQEPHSGEAYAGFGTYHQQLPEAKEHIGVKLIQSLTIGTKYYLTFYVSSGYTSLQVNIATNKIGALVTTYPYNDPDGILPLPNTSTVYTNSIFSDTVGWTKISGSFIADSAYQYLVIGCFFDDNNIDTLHFPYQVVPQFSYYYLDDVCLSTDSIYAATWTSIETIKKPKSATFYPNPSRGKLIVKSDYLIEKIEVFNSIGQLVYLNQPGEITEHEINLNHLPSGSYIIRISNSIETITNKLILNNQL
jgi:hypothetical protein